MEAIYAHRIVYSLGNTAPDLFHGALLAPIIRALVPCACRCRACPSGTYSKQLFDNDGPTYICEACPAGQRVELMGTDWLILAGALGSPWFSNSLGQRLCPWQNLLWIPRRRFQCCLVFKPNPCHRLLILQAQAKILGHRWHVSHVWRASTKIKLVNRAASDAMWATTRTKKGGPFAKSTLEASYYVPFAGVQI